MWIVTGASGFVGRNVLAALDAKGLSRADWEPLALARLLEGATGVVHAASVVHKPSTPADEYQRFNVEGTRALIEASRVAGVKRFVFVSSIKVHGESPSGIIDENTPVAAELDYAWTKAEAEKIVLAARDLNPIVLRLCPVYGRGDKGNVRTMIRAIARRRFFVPGDGATRKSIVHISTVADVVRAAARTPAASGVFIVADRQPPSIRELAVAIASELQRRRPISIPTPLVSVAADVAGRTARRLGIATTISAELIRKSQTSSVCDPSRAVRELGVTCHVDLRVSLRDEIAWLRSERLL